MKKPLLLVQAKVQLSAAQQSELFRVIKPVADAIGAEPLISDASTEVGVHQDLSPLLAAIEKQTAILNDLLLLARKSEERQARADKAHQAIVSANARIAAGNWS